MSSLCLKGCVVKSSLSADRVSTSPATVFFFIVLVLLGVCLIGVIVYVTKRVKTSR